MMKPVCLMFICMLAYWSGIGAGPARAEARSANVETTTPRVHRDLALRSLSRPIPQFSRTLEEARAKRRSLFSTALQLGNVRSVVASFARVASDPLFHARKISAVLTLEPANSGHVIDESLQYLPSDLLAGIAEELYQAIAEAFSDMPFGIFEAHVLATMRFDRRMAHRLVALGNTWDADNKARLARALVSIIDNSDLVLASAIETAIAIEGGEILQMAAAFRDEIAVSAIPVEMSEMSSPSALSPATIGGPGTVSAGSVASASGSYVTFAPNGLGTTMLMPGPSFTPKTVPSDVSPTN